MENNVDTTEEVKTDGIPLRGTFETQAYKDAKAKESEGGETTETSTETQTGDQTSTETSTETSTDTQVHTEVEDDYTKEFAELSELSGFEIKSYDDLVDNLKARRDLETQLIEAKEKLKSYEGLDPLALDIDKASKAGIDINQYLQARTLNPDTLSGKDLLREKFLLENAEQAKNRPDFVKMRFEREFTAKFGEAGKTYSDVDGDDFESKNEEANYQKAALQAEEDSAKRYLQDWKAKNVTIKEPAPQVTETGYTEEQTAAIRQEYTNKAKEFVSSVESVEIAVGDKSFTYGIEGHLAAIEKDLANPVETLQRHGIDLVNNKLDPDKMGELITAWYILKDVGFGKSLADFSIEQFNKQTITTKQTGTSPTQPLTGGAIPEKTLGQKIGEGFAAAREAKRSEQK